MRCPSCGQELGAPARGDWVYRSLPGTVLVGVEVQRCPACGDEEVSIPGIAELDRVLATAVAARPGRLTGPEIRFLRKRVGWSGADFARFFQTDPSTVSRWEAGTHAMDIRAEQLLRVSATRLDPIEDYAAFEVFLRHSGEDGPAPQKRVARWRGDRWELAA